MLYHEESECQRFARLNRGRRAKGGLQTRLSPPPRPRIGAYLYDTLSVTVTSLLEKVEKAFPSANW